MIDGGSKSAGSQRKRRRGIPLTAYAMALPILVFVAALFSPLIAVFSLALLPIILLAILVILIVEVATRRIPPWALLLPAFAVYALFGYHSSDGKTADRLLEKMSKEAAAPVVPIEYDPSIDGPIVFNGDFTLADEGSGSEVQVLVSRWDAPIVFTQRGADSTAWFNASETVCARAEDAARVPGSAQVTVDRRADGRCIVSLRATPPPRVVDVFGQNRYPGNYRSDTVLREGAYVTIHTVDVRKKGGSAHLVSGHVEKHGFGRTELLPFGQQETKERRVGRALGLTENHSRLVDDAVGIGLIDAERLRAAAAGAARSP